MSKIWDLLQDVERHASYKDHKDAERNQCAPVTDRRSTERVWTYTPVLVYGYAVVDDPFHEGTEALQVNARGGLITLSTAVEPGQTLLLINNVNQREQTCSVVRQVSPYLDRTAIVVKFPHPVPDFWDSNQPRAAK
jgi:hypothetical protein